MKVGMNSLHSHTVTRTCDHAQTKLHTVAEILLLSGTLHPIKTELTSSLESSLPLAKEQIAVTITQILDLVGEIVKSMPDFKNHWKETCEHLEHLSSAVIILVELCSHMTYQVLTTGKITPSEPALIDKYGATYSGLEIKLSCIQLKRARYEELTPSFIMDLCSNISRYISVLTDVCRVASDDAADSSTRDQFKLGVKSVTCAAGCLIACIKSFKGDNSAKHHGRLVIFCEPVIAASQALVSLGTEDEFVDQGPQLSHEEKHTLKAVFGPCMNIVSGCIQLCKVLREFTYDTSEAHHLHKAKACHNSVLKSTNHLKMEMHNHFRLDFQVKAMSPMRDEIFPEIPSNPDFIGLGRNSPSPQTANSNKSYGKDELATTRNDHSPRSSLAPSDLSISSGSVSR